MPAPDGSGGVRSVERARLSGSARERVVAGEDDEVVESGDRDIVLMVVTAHAEDGPVLAGLDVERDHDAVLLLRGVTHDGRPRILLPE